MAHQPIRFGQQRLATGVTLHYAEHGDPDGTPVICVPGYSDSWFSFSRVLELLPPDLHVWALDQRGHGDSERSATGYTIVDFARDVIAFMDALQLTQATLIGHSLGSFVAQQAALLAPERITGLVLIGSATTAVNEAVVVLQQAVQMLAEPIDRAFVEDFQRSTIHAEVPPIFFERTVDQSMKLPAPVWHAALDGLLASNITAQLGWITAPTLVIWGAHDAIFGHDQQQALLHMIASATLRIYDGSGHAPHWEQPQQVADDLVRFVKA